MNNTSDVFEIYYAHHTQKAYDLASCTVHLAQHFLSDTTQEAYVNLKCGEFRRDSSVRVIRQFE